MESNFYPNPTGKSQWFHGSPHAFEHFADERLEEELIDWDGEAPVKHWNTSLGPHFTSLYGVAERFAKGLYNEVSENRHGFIYKADLTIVNPKHYDTETQMNQDAWNRFGDRLSLPQDDWDDEIEPTPLDPTDLIALEKYLNSSDDAWLLADWMKEALKAEGYDAIVYGNEVEIPIGHTCIICFDESQVMNIEREDISQRISGSITDLPLLMPLGSSQGLELPQESPFPHFAPYDLQEASKRGLLGTLPDLDTIAKQELKGEEPLSW